MVASCLWKIFQTLTFHIWVQVKTMRWGHRPCPAIHVSTRNVSPSSSTMSHRPSTLQQIPRTRRLPTKWPHHIIATGAGPVCVLRTFDHLLQFHRSTTLSASGQGNIQHARSRINTNPSFLISFNNQRLLICLKTNDIFGVEVLRLPSHIQSFWYFSTWVFFVSGWGGGSLIQRAQYFFWSALNSINPSSPRPSFQPPLHHVSEHCSTAWAWKIPHCSRERGGERGRGAGGMQERKDESVLKWSHQWLF